jgi:hypothetical protein
MRRLAACLLFAAAAAACSEPLEFADWTIEVPEEGSFEWALQRPGDTISTA